MLNPKEPQPEEPWTQEELQLLHAMVQEYGRMQWLKKKAYLWLTMILGLPAGALMVWEPIVHLWKLIRGQ